MPKSTVPAPAEFTYDVIEVCDSNPCGNLPYGTYLKCTLTCWATGDSRPHVWARTEPHVEDNIWSIRSKLRAALIDIQESWFDRLQMGIVGGRVT